MPHVVVVGAGPGGLTTGIALAGAGFDVTMVEAMDRVGGRMNVVGDGTYRLDTGPSILQLTTHLDHAFWDRLNEEGAPVHFDQLAAVASTYGMPSAPPGVVTIDDLEGLDHTSFVTRAKEPLPARSLVSDYAAPAGTLSFDANGSKFPKSSYGAFLRYSQAAGYHLNADGECLIRRNF